MIDENIPKLDGYSLIRADHPGNMKSGGVCLYYKENLLLRHIKTEYFPQRVAMQDFNTNLNWLSCGYL